MLLFSTLPVHAWEYEIYARLGTAHIAGLAQTPKGGDVGTTSMNRPTFAEIEINHENFSDIGIGVSHCDYFAILDYQDFSPHGSTHLTNALITHNQFIPAGSDFNMHVYYHLTTLKAGRIFAISNTSLTIAPFLEGDYVQYHYGFDSPTAQSNRDFNLAGLSIGFIAEYQIDQAFSIDFTAKNTIPLSKLQISQLDLGINYTFNIQKHLSFTPRLSLGFERIDYEDNQIVPNHIHYQALPYGTLGFSLSFLA